MPLADSKHDVEIAGTGYILMEESYRKKAQPAFNPRFASGDYSFRDLSFWQFLSQDNWVGGEGQDDFVTLTKYRQAAGWTTRNGMPSLAQGYSPITQDNPLPTPMSPISYGIFDDFENDMSKWTLHVESYTACGNVYSAVGTAFGGKCCRVSSGSVTNSVYPDQVVYGYNAIAPQSAISGTWQFTFVLSQSGWNDTALLGVSPIWIDNSNKYTLTSGGLNGKVFTFTKYVGGTATQLAQWTGAEYGEAITIIKIVRTTAWLWSIYQDGNLLGTITDGDLLTCNGTEIVVPMGGRVYGDPGYSWAGIDDVYFPGPLNPQNAGYPSKNVIYENSLYTCYRTDGLAFAFTTVKNRSYANNIPGITHLNAIDMITWSRDGEPTGGTGTLRNTFLVAAHNKQLRVFTQANTTVTTINLNILCSCIIPINATTLLLAGTSADYDGYTMFERLVFSGNAWTVASQTPIHLDGGGQGVVCNTYAVDKDGLFVLSTTDMTNTLGTNPSRVFLIDSTDILATQPTVSQSEYVPNFRVRGLFALSGEVYLYGATLENKKATSAIIKYPGTPFYKSTVSQIIDPVTDGIAFNFGIQSTFKTATGMLFLTENDLALWNPVCEARYDGTIAHVGSFAAGTYAYATPNMISIAEWCNRLYLINPRTGIVWRTNGSAGTFPSTFADMRLELSGMGGNSQNILKTLYSVTIELSEAMPTNQVMYLNVNGTEVGSLTSTNALRKEIVLTTEITASSFKPIIRCVYGCTWQGYIKRIIFKYVPTQFKKKAWGFGIRATKALKLADGTHESNLPATLFTNIEAAWLSNTPTTFKDVDGVSYSVIITDFDQRRPLLDRRGAPNAEAFYFLELLEI